ncbi:SDR family NAD(P)-dependent oxidoreductase [Solwaraspora sp. WMMA2080]|uniref:SDR family NAD(P)-dependent oxidoreductase n=1 Tax=unclassified Solwaraspora TaxID=2627926 RepID=UPI00248CF86F|nr:MULTISPECIES: SDR family oxidoreductase [unclassified Solwaraspora]WBB99951.1 SDR family NAD(P)-dependent oxidoreductase [Solwaraspora sp. WMMA2059]WBC21502.1 SDR family NAD(P)-dependent oxidoreductase [Solwaraspora sp. WMMA2080]
MTGRSATDAADPSARVTGRGGAGAAGATPAPPVALITAAAHGIGAATARSFAEAGYRLVLADVDAAGLAATAADLAGADRVTTVVADATSEAGAATAVDAATTRYGRLDALINVVGGSRPGRTVIDIDLAEWDRWLSLNLTSVYLMCRAALPQLTAVGGAIVNVSSGAGLRGMRANPAYCAAKAGVVGLTRALAIDHGPAGIRVNCVAPGPVRTPLMERNRSAAEIDAMGRIAVLGRIGDPAEIAAAIRWLASDAASYLTGQTIEVDGGPAPLV